MLVYTNSLNIQYTQLYQFYWADAASVVHPLHRLLYLSNSPTGSSPPSILIILDVISKSAVTSDHQFLLNSYCSLQLEACSLFPSPSFEQVASTLDEPQKNVQEFPKLKKILAFKQIINNQRETPSVINSISWFSESQLAS